MASLGSENIDCRQDGAALDPSLGRASYIFNAGIDGIEKADAVLLIGTNPRKEAAILNARIRKAWRANNMPIGVIGEAGELRYSYELLGAGTDTLAEVVDGKHKFAKVLKSAKNPLIIVGQGALSRKDGAAVLGLAARLATGLNAVRDDWNGFAVLHIAASRVGGLDIGFVPGKSGKDASAMMGALDVLFLAGADELAMDKIGTAFVVYMGTHGDNGAHRADVILPGSAYTEKFATYVNTEGRVQRTARAGFAPGEAKEDWAILRALSAVLGKTLPFDSLAQLRAAMHADFPHLAKIGVAQKADASGVANAAKLKGALNKAPFASAVADFYLTNPIARASAVMAECSALAKGESRQAAE